MRLEDRRAKRMSSTVFIHDGQLVLPFPLLPPHPRTLLFDPSRPHRLWILSRLDLDRQVHGRRLQRLLGRSQIRGHGRRRSERRPLGRELDRIVSEIDFGSVQRCARDIRVNFELQKSPGEGLKREGNASFDSFELTIFLPSSCSLRDQPHLLRYLAIRS